MRPHIPWELRWRTWVMAQKWAIQDLWRGHKWLLALAGLGIVYAARLITGR
jgi:hypothetical protein